MQEETKQQNNKSGKDQVEAIDTDEHFVYKSLVAQLGDPSPLRRETACWMLGELRYRPADKIISRLLTKDSDPLVRYGATHALERIADSWAVQAIIRGLKDSDPLVRRACIDSLERLHDKQAIYPLEALIKFERDEELVVLAKGALLKIRGKKVVNSSSNEKKIYKYLQQTELRPDSANAHYNLAVAYFHAGRLKESKDHCNQAKRLGANVGWLVGKLESDQTVVNKTSDDNDDTAPKDDVHLADTGETNTVDLPSEAKVEESTPLATM